MVLYGFIRFLTVSHGFLRFLTFVISIRALSQIFLSISVYSQILVSALYGRELKIFFSLLAKTSFSYYPKYVIDIYVTPFI